MLPGKARWGRPGDRVGRGVPRRARIQDGELLAGRISALPAGFQAGFPGFCGKEGAAKSVSVTFRPPTPFGGQAPVAAGSAWVAASPALSHFFSPWAPTICSLYFSPPTPARSHGGRASSGLSAPPGGPRGSAPALGPRFAAGLSPPAAGTAGGPQERSLCRAGTSGFPRPTFLSRPNGMCSSSSHAAAPRETGTRGPKTTNPCMLRNEGGRGAVLSVLVLSVGDGNQQRNGVDCCPFPAGDLPCMTHVLYLIFTTTLRDTVVSGLRERTATCQKSRSAGW